MHNKRVIYILVMLAVCLLLAGAFIRYEVMQGRSQPETKLVTDFSSCLETGGGLDVTGTTCTSTAGTPFIKPGSTGDTSATSETPTPTSTNTTTTDTLSPLPLGAATTFMLQDEKTMSDGTKLTLIALTDSRCKPDVQCIWAGEISTEWQLETATGSTAISLGTVRAKAETAFGVTYTLVDANANQAIITVTKANTARTTGTVTGTVTIGPICPVTRIDTPCVIPPETYTSRSIVVFAADNVTALERHTLDTKGQYSFTLVPGTYGLQVQPAGIGPGEISSVRITDKGVHTVDFDIDTGIR